MLSGLLVGPALNYPIALIVDMKFSLLTISPLNVVGLVMVALLLLGVLAIHLFFIEPPVGEDDASSAKDKNVSFFEKVKSVASIGMISLIICQFVALFNQTALEMALPPITLLYWEFGQLQNSIIYAVLTVYLLLLFVLISCVAKYTLDRTLILVGWICVGVGIVFIVTLNILYGGVFWQFCTGSAIFAGSIPFFDTGKRRRKEVLFLSSLLMFPVPTAVASLFSKLIRQKDLQGRAQSLLGTSNTLATLLGPVSGAPVLAIAPVYLFVMVGGLFVVSFSFFLFSFRFLKPPPEDPIKEISQEEEAEEKLIN